MQFAVHRRLTKRVIALLVVAAVSVTGVVIADSSAGAVGVNVQVNPTNQTRQSGTAAQWDVTSKSGGFKTIKVAWGDGTGPHTFYPPAPLVATAVVTPLSDVWDDVTIKHVFSTGCNVASRNFAQQWTLTLTNGSVVKLTTHVKVTNAAKCS